MEKNHLQRKIEIFGIWKGTTYRESKEPLEYGKEPLTEEGRNLWDMEKNHLQRK